MTNKFEFCGKILREGQPPFLVAEVGFNHNGDVALAKRMILAAKENGADAVKLQTFVAGELLSRTHMAEDPAQPGSKIPLYQFFERSELRSDEYEELFAYARDIGIPLFSTPFDDDSLKMLVDLGAPAIKVASPDLTYLPFLEKVARTGLPVVLSTGMGTEEEIGQAVQTIQSQGNNKIVLLHCVSNYPSRYEEMNLRCLERLRSVFSLPVGLSDHTTDNLTSIVAGALGAVMIEKHFTTDRNLPGADNAISMEPAKLRELKTALLNVEAMLGDGQKKVQPSEEPVRQSARRSLVARVDIEPGTVLTEALLTAKRPGTGISPVDRDRVIGKKTKSKILAEQVLTWDMI
jgi:N-acetylneuraminate synthase/N,N'-diacetyllegionaminate synthase